VVMILHCRTVMKLLCLEPFTPCGGSNRVVWSVLLAAGCVILLCVGCPVARPWWFRLWKAYNSVIER
jgi:hypothetical protein